MVEYDEDAARETERMYLTPEVVRQRIRTLQALSLQAGERVLDVGCGTGLLAHDMALQVGLGGRVLGLDKSPTMLQLARHRCAHLPQVELKEGVAENLPESDRSADAAACVQVLLYVPAVERVLAEMHRVLEPGGRIAVVETDWRGTVLNSRDQELTRCILGAWDETVPSPNLPVRLAPLLKQAGFAAIRVEAIPFISTSCLPGTFSAGMADWAVRAARDQGSVSEEEAEAWISDLKRLGEEGAYFFSVNRFLFSAVKR